jgi:predicted anti-sigma-YlaC factor YlaD
MVRQLACERARTWVSLRLDGELSELEGALLDAHLGRCAECVGVAATMAAATREIRDAPLVAPPARPSLAQRRGQGSLRAFYAATASTVVAVVALTSVGFVGAVHIVSQSATPPKLERVSAVATESDLLVHLRTQRLERPVPGRILWLT